MIADRATSVPDISAVPNGVPQYIQLNSADAVAENEVAKSLTILSEYFRVRLTNWPYSAFIRITTQTRGVMPKVGLGLGFRGSNPVFIRPTRVVSCLETYVAMLPTCKGTYCNQQVSVSLKACKHTFLMLRHPHSR